MDLCICVLTLLFIWPLWALIAILIRLDSPGPAVFVQDRIGQDGQPFRLYKFRTMHLDLDQAAHEAFMRSYVNGSATEDAADGTLYKPVQDSHVTSLGRFLRRSSLDELPQILNVLKGEMSLVGPRPNVPWEVEEYKPRHRRRLEALPGMTGLAQIKGRSCLTFDDIVEYDIEYIEAQSLLLDLKILIWTGPMVLRGAGAS
jgi:lipopolysaccharide/colanic/teichoic acid biosynthesis glycosyltransferase